MVSPAGSKEWSSLPLVWKVDTHPINKPGYWYTRDNSVSPPVHLSLCLWRGTCSSSSGFFSGISIFWSFGHLTCNRSPRVQFLFSRLCALFTGRTYFRGPERLTWWRTDNSTFVSSLACSSIRRTCRDRAITKGYSSKLVRLIASESISHLLHPRFIRSSYIPAVSLWAHIPVNNYKQVVTGLWGDPSTFKC